MNSRMRRICRIVMTVFGRSVYSPYGEHFLAFFTLHMQFCNQWTPQCLRFTEFSFWSYSSGSHWWGSFEVFGVCCLSNNMLLAIVNHSCKCLCFIVVQIRLGDKLISSCQEQGLELGLVWLVVICRLIVAAHPPIHRQQWQWLDPKIRFANKHLHCANACWKDTSLRFSTIILQNNRDLKRV